MKRVIITTLITLCWLLPFISELFIENQSVLGLLALILFIIVQRTKQNKSLNISLAVVLGFLFFEFENMFFDFLNYYSLMVNIFFISIIFDFFLNRFASKLHSFVFNLD